MISRLVRIGAALAFGLAALVCPIPAQEEETFDLFRPRLEVAFDSARERSFSEDEDPFVDAGTDTFRRRSLGLNLNLPLGGTRLHSDGPLLGHQFFAHASSERSRAEISFLEENPRLYSGGVGFTALMLSERKNLYAASLFANIAEEEESLDDPEIRYTGLALGSVRKGSGLLVYGGAFTYQLGRGLVLPVIGGWGELGGNWSVAGVFPFVLRFGYRSSPDWNLGLFLKVRGNRYGFENQRAGPGRQRQFPGEPEEVFLRLVQGRIGAEIGWSPSSRLTLLAESGAQVGRRLIFSDGDEEFITAGIEPSGYLRVKLRMTFGESLFDEGSP